MCSCHCRRPGRLAHTGEIARFGTIAWVLVGRDAERAEVAALLEAARGSSGGALVIRGVAGSGKSALLADAAAAAADMTVLRTQGVESESPLAFAALQRLLWPLRKGVGGLPAPQRAALQAAFGEVEGEGDRFLAFLGTLSLLADAAEERPVLVIADDAHWLDEASAAALLFVARRLQAERVALLFAARDGVASGFDAGELPCLTLGGLSGEPAGQLLRGHAPEDVDAAVRDRLVTATGGNPLALGELSEVLSADQLSGRAPLPEQLPLTGGVERAFLDRYRRLPEAAQRFLLVAAADDTARLPVVRDAAGRLDAGDDALDAVEQAGLLRVDGDVLTLYHPLVRSAVYRAATSAQRRAAHRALAGALDGDADRRAWHLAAASDRPDDAVAGALEAVAERATARRGHEAAAAAWSRAAELTADPAVRARRLGAAAHAAWHAAQPARARALADAARPDAADPLLRADLDRLRARVDWNVGSTLVGHRILLQAARDVAPVDAERARAMTMVAAALVTFVGEGADDMSAQAATLGDVTAATSGSARCYARLLAGFVHVRNGQFAEAAAQFRPALADCDPREDTDLRANLGIAAFHLGDDHVVQAHHTRLLTDARESGALALIVHALTRRACGDVAAGDWDALAAGAAEALDLAGSSGQPALTRFPHGWLAVLAALRDQRDATRRAPAGDRGPAQRRSHRPPGRRPRPVGPRPDRGDAGGCTAPSGADGYPHDTTGGARPHRGRRPRRARRPGSRLVGRTRPVRRGGRVGLGARRRRLRTRAAVRRRARARAVRAGDPARRHRRAPVRPGADPPRLRRVPAPRPPPGRCPRPPAHRARNIRRPRSRAVGHPRRARAARLRRDRPPPRRHHRDPAHRPGTAGRRARSAGPVQPGRRRTAVPQPPHRRLPPAQRVQQARPQLPRRTRRAPARLRPVTPTAAAAGEPGDSAGATPPRRLIASR